MLVVELTYEKSLSEVEMFLDQHKNFLTKYYNKGIFLASGPKEPRDGGIILANTDKETMNVIIHEDPFFRNDIAKYKIIQFEPNRANLEKIKSIFSF